MELDRLIPSLTVTVALPQKYVEVEAARPYRSGTVRFVFLDIEALTISDFNHQNVLADIVIQYEDRFNVAFASIFGVEARFWCRAISITNVAPS